MRTPAFHGTVLASNPAIAVFDCDGTLWSGDAGTAFMQWTIETGLLSREAADWLDVRYRAYKRGEVSELDMCGDMVRVYHDLREEELRRAAAQFFATQMHHNIFPEMLALVTALQQQGADIWAVSSTNGWVIEEGVRRFNIPTHRVLCSRVAIVDGVVTDRILGVPTGAGKVAALAAAGVLTPDAVFGNSFHDAAMLAIARIPFAINPTSELSERSIAEGWPIYFPGSANLA